MPLTSIVNKTYDFRVERFDGCDPNFSRWINRYNETGSLLVCILSLSQQAHRDRGRKKVRAEKGRQESTESEAKYRASYCPNLQYGLHVQTSQSILTFP